MGHLRQPWDPRDRARQEPPVGARCPVTQVEGMISGYDYDYDYIYIHVYLYLLIFVYDVHDEMGASRGREKHPCFYSASGSF